MTEGRAGWQCPAIFVGHKFCFIRKQRLDIGTSLVQASTLSTYTQYMMYVCACFKLTCWAVAWITSVLQTCLEIFMGLFMSCKSYKTECTTFLGQCPTFFVGHLFGYIIKHTLHTDTSLVQPSKLSTCYMKTFYFLLRQMSHIENFPKN